jgi:predicted amidophosphoribosyltransferase
MTLIEKAILLLHTLFTDWDSEEFETILTALNEKAERETGYCMQCQDGTRGKDKYCSKCGRKMKGY